MAQTAFQKPPGLTDDEWRDELSRRDKLSDAELAAELYEVRALVQLAQDNPLVAKLCHYYYGVDWITGAAPIVPPYKLNEPCPLTPNELYEAVDALKEVAPELYRFFRNVLTRPRTDS